LVRIRRVAGEEFLLIVLYAAFGIVFLTVFPPTLLVADSWLTLVAGREVIEHGLPDIDELTVLGVGQSWTDQQWGAQLIAYGSHALGGHGLLAVVVALFAIGAFAIAAAAARTLGAGPRSILLTFFPVLLAAPWTFTIRAQVFALPLFTGLIWLLASEARNPSRRVYLVFPILVVWANIHGSAALAAMLTMLLGACELLSTRGRSGLRSLALLVLSPLALLATPYGPVDTARYYHLLLVDPPFGRELVTEWRRSDPSWDTLVFYLLAALALVSVVWGRRRLKLFDMAALGLTFAGAVLAIRGIPWFALSCLVLVPVALGPALEARTKRMPRAFDRGLSYGAVAVLALVAILALARDDSWYLKNWPEGAVTAVRNSLATPETRAFATSRDADWILWSIPELRGRLAYDVRFEIYDRETFERIVRFRGEQGDDWKSLADGYQVVVFETHQEPSSHVDDFLAEEDARTVYADERVTVIQRRAPS
jgi:Tfp pilus assembly protein FimT